MQDQTIKDPIPIIGIVIGAIIVIAIGSMYYLLGSILAGIIAGFIGNIKWSGVKSGALSGLIGVFFAGGYSFATGELLWHIREHLPYDTIADMGGYGYEEAFLMVNLLAIILFPIGGAIGGKIGTIIENRVL